MNSGGDPHQVATSIHATLWNAFIFFTTDATAYSFARYGQGSGPIHLDNVACTGTENALVNCTYDSDTSDCSHFEDAGVLCQRKYIANYVYWHILW